MATNSVEEIEVLMDEKLGAGSYGSVFKGRIKATGLEVAVKCFSVSTYPEGIDVGILRELVYLKSIPRHENIIELLKIEWYKNNQFIRVAMPLYKFDLAKIIRQDCLTNDLRLRIARHILLGLDHLHSHRIFHRDIKPGNILVDKDMNAVICDFSLATTYLTRTDHSSDVQTVWYRAPEILLGCKTYDKSIDIWSFGCVLGAMWNGNDIFRSICEIDQLFQIFYTVGTPTDDSWPEWTTFRYHNRAFPPFKGLLFDDAFPDVTELFPVFANLIRYSLLCNPMQRYSTRQLLETLQSIKN